MSDQARQTNADEAKQSAVSLVRVTIAPDKLTASIKVPWPVEDKPAVTLDDIKEALKETGIVFGIDDAAVEGIITNSSYDEYVVVAKGHQPVAGKDAYLEYKFEEIQKLRPTEDADGRIDYKDINFVRCTEKGQLLVEKIPAQEGVAGTDVLGNPVSARSGKDIKLPAGANTRISEDGLQLFADADGSLVTAGKRVNINEVHTVGGGVCNKTGNIKHNGSLIIQGTVEGGYEVIAKGDIEIFKNVLDAKVVSGGSIMVKGGFLGNYKGLLKAEGDIHCKYINDQLLMAERDIYVGGEVFNGRITAKNRVLVSGSKGRIVGGRIMAGDEIKATCIGADAGTRTELQVAYNAKLMKLYHGIVTELKELAENEERVKEGLYTFYRLQMDGKLSPDKQAALTKLEQHKKALPARIKELNDQKAALEAEIQKNQKARIIAVQKVYPGVVLHFGVIYKEITDEMGPSFFTLHGGTIVHEEYKPSKDDK